MSVEVLELDAAEGVIGLRAVAHERMRRANLFCGLWNDVARSLAIRCATLLSLSDCDEMARVLARRFRAATDRRDEAHARMMRYGRVASPKVGGA